MDVRVNDLIKIMRMDGEPRYRGVVGRVLKVDDAGQIHGTWGGCALIPGEDKFAILSRPSEGDFLIWKSSTMFSPDELDNLLQRFAESNFKDIADRYAWFVKTRNSPLATDWLQTYCKLVFEKDFSWKSKWTEASWAGESLIVTVKVTSLDGQREPGMRNIYGSLRNAIKGCHLENAEIYEDHQGDFCIRSVTENNMYEYKIRTRFGGQSLNFCHEVLGWDGHWTGETTE